jgi:hypothetical protein
MTKGNKIIHLEFKDGGNHYFGSIAALCDTFDAASLGISKQGLYDYGVTPEKPYANKICRKSAGKLRKKKGGRKNPNAVCKCEYPVVRGIYPDEYCAVCDKKIQ